MSILTQVSRDGLSDIDKISVVFFGTGYVSQQSLAALSEHFQIEAVVSKANQSNRSTQAQDSEVMLWSKQHRIPTHVANTSAEVEEIFSNHGFASRLAIVVDFGVIISQSVIDYFESGILNSHFSLLPKWRGADPISFAIWAGDEKTGVSLMKIVSKLDEGPIVGDQVEYSIKTNENSASLTQELINLSNQQMIEKIPLYLGDDLVISEQDHSAATYSRKLTRADGKINWHNSTNEIDRQIRALIEWPVAYSEFGAIETKVYEATIGEERGTPGELFIKNRKLAVYTGDGSLQLDTLQPANKSKMSGQDFLNGYRNKLDLAG